MDPNRIQNEKSHYLRDAGWLFNDFGQSLINWITYYLLTSINQLQLTLTYWNINVNSQFTTHKQKLTFLSLYGVN